MPPTVSSSRAFPSPRGPSPRGSLQSVQALLWVQGLFRSKRGRAFLTGAGVYAFSLGGDLLSQLLLFPVITRVLSVRAFSQFVLLVTAGPLLLVLSDLGVSFAAVRALARESDLLRRRSIIATSLWARMFTATPMVGLALLLGWLFRERLEPGLLNAVRLAAAEFWLGSLVGTAVDLVRGQERHVRAGAALTARSVSRMGLGLGALLLWQLGLPGLMAARIAAQLLALAVVMWALRSDLQVRPRWKVYRELVAFGAPGAAYLALRSGSALDRYILRVSSGPIAASVYQIASMPSAGIDLLELAGVMAAEPYLYATRPEERQGALDRMVRGFSVLLLSAAFVLGALGPKVISLLGPSTYAGALSALPWLIFGAALRSITRLIGLSAGVVGRSSVWAWAGLTDTVGVLIMALLVAPRFGSTGVAMGRLPAAIASLCVCSALVARTARSQLPWGRVLFCSMVGTGSCALLSTRSLQEMVSWPLRVVLMVAFVLLCHRALLSDGAQPVSPDL